MTSLQKTQVDLSGLLEVLGKNLYSTPLVALRELIQNAHDACSRHRIETTSARDYQIQVFAEPDQHILRIIDNGSGLTRQEIDDFLATIGSGYTRVLRNKSDEDEMIGYFGLGFLSAYVVADRVEVITESYQNKGEAWLFASNGGHRYRVSAIKPRPAGCGSEVILHLKEEAYHLADLDILNQVLSQYCCLLPTPILLGEQATLINNEPAPWLYSGSLLQQQKKQMVFAKRFEQYFEPICVLPLLETELAVQGFLWIQDGSGYGTADFRNANVFVRHMHITDKVADLLPKWAGFVGCLLNANCLTPTASREDIQQDEAFQDLQDLLHHSLVSGLQNLSKKQPANWRRVLRRHNQNLLGAAVADEDLFYSLKEELKLPTSDGDIKVSAILRQTQNKFYIQALEEHSYQSILLSSQGIPIISGYLFAVIAFCRLYADISGADLIIMGQADDSQKMFPEIRVEPEIYNKLKKLFCLDPCEKLTIANFEPDFIPMVMLEDEAARLKKSIDSDEADKRIGSAALILARKFTKKIDDKVERHLYLNMQSQLIQILLELPEYKAAQYARLIRGYVFAIVGSSDRQAFSQSISQYFNDLILLLTNKED